MGGGGVPPVLPVPPDPEVGLVEGTGDDVSTAGAVTSATFDGLTTAAELDTTGGDATAVGAAMGASAFAGAMSTGAGAEAALRWVRVVDFDAGHTANSPRVTSAATTTSADTSRPTRSQRTADANAEEGPSVKRPPS